MICPILSQSSRDREGNVLWEHHDCIENACTFWAEQERECGLRASGLLAVRRSTEPAVAAAAPPEGALGETLSEALAKFESAQREMGLNLLEGVSALEEPIKAGGQGVAQRLEGMNASLLTLSTALEGRLSRLEERLETIRESAPAAPPETPAWVIGMEQGLSRIQLQLERLGSRLDQSDRGSSALAADLSALRSAQSSLESAITESLRGQAKEADRRAGEEARALNLRGAGLYHRGAFDAAESMFRAAIGKDDSFAEAHNNLGLVLSRLGRGREAEACFARALELNPALAEAMNNLGVLFHEGLEFEKAAELFRRAAAQGPEGSVAWLNLGNACHRMGRHGEAVEAWKRAVQCDPLNEAARQALSAYQQGSQPH